MANNRYFFYDQESCTFVEARPKRTRLYAQAVLVAALAFILALGLTLAFDRMTNSPQEMALIAEREALQKQLSMARLRMKEFSKELESLAQTDEQVYRTLLDAEPIPDETRQVGVGGSDRYGRFDGFTQTTSSLLRESSQLMDQLERQIGLQNASYRELVARAEERSEYFAQLPALMPANGRLVSGFGMRRHPILHVSKMHKGVDILLRQGSPIFAPGDGVVKTVGNSPTYGIYLEVTHPETGYTTLYAHLSAVQPGIRVGKTVERGEKIALSGNTGRSTGPHLHYEVIGPNGESLNPIQFFAPTMTPQEYTRLVREAEAAQSPLSLD